MYNRFFLKDYCSLIAILSFYNVNASPLLFLHLCYGLCLKKIHQHEKMGSNFDKLQVVLEMSVLELRINYY